MDVYLQEYSADDAVARYTSRAAGHGISYLLNNDYAEVYLSAIRDFLKTPPKEPLRLLEFGCGGGMNLITLLTLLEREGKRVELAIGADFSEKLILAAIDESKRLLDAAQQQLEETGDEFTVDDVVARARDMVQADEDDVR